MNIKQLLKNTLVISFSALFFTQALAQETSAPAAGPVTAPAETAPTSAAEPVTGYQGMLPYIQENATIRKEAKKKYGAEKSRKKSKKSNSKTASKKKIRNSASVKKSTGKKAKSPKKKSPGSRQGST
ncbi:hypothetical protein DOM22_08960 [Bdellovibrio sp. ZAP7]|uniref:hypothetical protein n=1 Tax=Bdellovibrio sp. ZAP7 TaxID=2231053 RepID=UPI00115A7526|nr:hypothetical protein [Bdellovibrio sp. ZAP7]QDK45273.1 hypothetical protein DOM22_08960 [Bdellovibrio sp. ZAP7]